MSTIFTWKILQLDTKPSEGEFSNVVITAHWECVGTFEQYTGRVYNNCSFNLPNEGSNYINYEDLTEEQVLEWIWQFGNDKTSAEISVQQQIDDQINPPIVQLPLPWS